MSSPADIIYQFLLDAGLAVDTAGDWQAFVGVLPDAPDNAVCINDTAGREDGRLMADGKKIIHPGIQVTVRGLDYAQAWTKANDIAQAMDAVRLVSVAVDSSTNYLLHNISRSGDIIPMGLEPDSDRRRHLFAVNATVTLSQN